MTTETWVWMHLPGDLKPTLCGVVRHDGRVSRFVYGKSYLALRHAVPIDPIALPLQEKEYATATDPERKTELESFRGPVRCTACDGSRLRREAMSVFVGPE